LLVKGSHTFLNMWIGAEAQWFPEYGVDLGPAAGPLPASVEALRRPNGLYVRRYARGMVVINPGSRYLRLGLDVPMRLVRPVGGGALDSAADTRGWGLRLQPVTGAVTIPGHGGTV